MDEKDTPAIRVRMLVGGGNILSRWPVPGQTVSIWEREVLDYLDSENFKVDFLKRCASSWKAREVLKAMAADAVSLVELGLTPFPPVMESPTLAAPEA